MIKSKCATTVSENSTSARPLRNTGKKILVDYDVDSGLFPIRWSIKKLNETTPKKREQKKSYSCQRTGHVQTKITALLRITLMAELLELRVDDRSLEDSEVLLKHAATEAAPTVSRPKRRRLEPSARNY